MRPLLERGHLAVAHLVQDPARILVAEVVDAASPASSPSARSVVAASSGANGSACRLVKMLSRPNIVMNQGSPAAGRLRPPATGGENRSAARSTRLRRYVALQRLPVALERGRVGEPPVEVRLHVRSCAGRSPCPYLETLAVARGIGDDDVELGRPLAVRGES